MPEHSSFQSTLVFDSLDLDLVIKVLKNTAFSEEGYLLRPIKTLPLHFGRSLLHILRPGALLVTEPKLECTHRVLEYSLVPCSQPILSVYFRVYVSFGMYL